MALNVTNPTLIDVLTRMGDGGKVEKQIVEILNQTNEILDDATFLECNDGSSHKTTIRSGLPSATWRLLNYGVQPSKSTTVQVKDSCGMLEAYAEVDKALVDMSGDPQGFRASEDAAFLEGMNQTMSSTAFYGNTATNPERFMGLAPRFSDATSAENKDNILKGGGAGNANTSVWLIVWGPQTVHFLYPKGSKAGFSREDKGQVTLEDANKGKYEGYRTHYKWDAGLSVRDWRYIVRICNIDVSALVKDAATGADLVDLMTQALELVPNLSMGRPVFYGNRTVRSFLRRQIKNAKNMNITMEEIAGKKVVAFDGVPFRRVDSILNTEATVA